MHGNETSIPQPRSAGKVSPIVFRFADTSAVPATTPAIPALSDRPRILIVEDGLIIAEDMRRRCESLGYCITAVVASGEEALDIATLTRPNLVLMDIRLRGLIDGIEAARRIREKLDIPVVYCTSYSDDATIERAKQTGPFGYILKPVEPRELHTTIEMALHHHAAELDLRDAEERYQALLETSFDAIAILDAKGTITACSNRCAAFLGLGAPAAVVGRKISEFLAAGDARHGADLIAQTIQNGSILDAELTFKQVNSAPVRGVVNTRSVNGRMGTQKAVLAVIRHTPHTPVENSTVPKSRRQRPQKPKDTAR
jgi:PAS domain S-box-containing protein